jgi:hypothetical protein
MNDCSWVRIGLDWEEDRCYTQRYGPISPLIGRRPISVGRDTRYETATSRQSVGMVV